MRCSKCDIRRAASTGARKSEVFQPGRRLPSSHSDKWLPPGPPDASSRERIGSGSLRPERGNTAASRLALSGGRMAEMIAVALRKVRRRLESAGSADRHDRHRGLQQELAGALEPQLDVIALRNAVDLLLEQPLDLPAREP